MLLLSSALIRKILTPAACIPLMRRAFVAEAEGRAVQPIRQIMSLPGNGGILGMMPGCVLGDGGLGAKVVSVIPGNSGTKLPSHQGLVVLMDPITGSPSAILDAAAITAVRTAAATAAATDALARGDAKTLGIYGCGQQAMEHITSISLVRRLSKVVVFGREIKRALAFARECEAVADCTIFPVSEIEGPASCDIICTVTAAREPFLQSSWLHPGQHLNLVGSSTPDASEAFPDIMRSGRFFVDFVQSARVLAGEFVKAKRENMATDEDIVGSIGDVLIGRIPGRISDTDTTVFKSLGMSAEDLIAAGYVFEQAKCMGLGVEVHFD